MPRIKDLSTSAYNGMYPILKTKYQMSKDAGIVDWEIPDGVWDRTISDAENKVRLLQIFEKFNRVELADKALDEFLIVAPYFYDDAV